MSDQTLDEAISLADIQLEIEALRRDVHEPLAEILRELRENSDETSMIAGCVSKSTTVVADLELILKRLEARQRSREAAYDEANAPITDFPETLRGADETPRGGDEDTE